MFNPNLPPNPTIDDFHKAKAELHIQHLNKVAQAPDKDQWAFGTIVAVSSRRVTAKFRNVLRSLNETCVALTGQSCMDVKEMDRLEDLG